MWKKSNNQCLIVTSTILFCSKEIESQPVVQSNNLNRRKAMIIIAFTVSGFKWERNLLKTNPDVGKHLLRQARNLSFMGYTNTS